MFDRILKEMRNKVCRREYVMTLHAEEEMNDDCLTICAYERRRQMICEICGEEGARVRRITRTYGKGKDILIIENVPVIIYSHCGESYLEAETLHEIERIKLHKKGFAVKRSISVVNFV